MANKLLTNDVVLTLANKLMEGSKIELRKFTPLDQGFPVTGLRQSELTVASFDSGTARGVQTIDVRLVSVNVGRESGVVEDVINTIFDRLHQKVDDWARVGTDWKFFSVTIGSVSTINVFDAKNPATEATLTLRIVAEYIGS